MRTVAMFIIASMQALLRGIRTCGEGAALDKDLQLPEKRFSAFFL
jgi:hypothetical protein